MNLDFFGKLVTGILCFYFIGSGIIAAIGLDAKLSRIGLQAINADGKIAFLLIYSGLMIGIGVAMALIFYFSGSWSQPLVLAVTILISFITFRIIGSIIVGYVSKTQLGYMFTEFIEVTVVLLLLIKSSSLKKRHRQPNSRYAHQFQQ